ncbi:unnamed protein product [Arctogadus glacialis]
MLPKILADANQPLMTHLPALPLPPHIDYKNVSKSPQARKAHRANTLKQQPDILRTDLSGTGGKAIINSLLMFRENTEAWHKAIYTALELLTEPTLGQPGHIIIPPSTALTKPTPHGAAQPFPPTPPVQQLSYAQALQRPGSRNNADIGEITQPLSLIFTKRIGQVV